MRIPRLVVAGVSSGVGKTSVTCAIIHAMRNCNVNPVTPFKAGPDYIDPGYLSAAAGRDAYNLDEWLMGKRGVLENFVRHSNPNGVSVIEGVMGYYDGHSADSDTASTYSVASITRSPVLLVIDASKAARSVAATALGFRTFRRHSRIAGVILNRLGSDRHASLCTRALSKEGIATVGCIPRDETIHLEERHLGLFSTLDEKKMRGRLQEIADKIIQHLDVEAIRTIAYSAGMVPPTKYSAAVSDTAKQHAPAHDTQTKTTKTRHTEKFTIAVALDSSFNFYYPDNLEALRREGAHLAFFSPVHDRVLPACDGLYIGGGFPEVLASQLGRNISMRKSIRGLAQDGAPIYAECGGLMYLAKYIEDEKGKRHKMVGLLDASVKMTGKPVLGYTRGSIRPGTPITDRGRLLRGHEFHYSRMTDVALDTKFAMTLREGQGISDGMDGIIQDNTLASYGHLYFDASDYAARFAGRCAHHKRR